MESQQLSCTCRVAVSTLLPGATHVNSSRMDCTSALLRIPSLLSSIPHSLASPCSRPRFRTTKAMMQTLPPPPPWLIGNRAKTGNSRPVSLKVDTESETKREATPEDRQNSSFHPRPKQSRYWNKNTTNLMITLSAFLLLAPPVPPTRTDVQCFLLCKYERAVPKHRTPPAAVKGKLLRIISAVSISSTHFLISSLSLLSLAFCVDGFPSTRPCATLWCREILIITEYCSSEDGGCSRNNCQKKNKGRGDLKRHSSCSSSFIRLWKTIAEDCSCDNGVILLVCHLFIYSQSD